MHWLDQCLKSCADYPVIIIDNASIDNTVAFIEQNYPNVILFKQKENLGFGQANNLGIRYALDQGAEHVFLLNQDAYLVDTVLNDLVAFQKKQPKHGILSPIHITGDQIKLDKNFSIFMRKECSGQFYSDFVLGNTLKAVYEVPFINAAAWLISKACLETVGGFDPLFFHYAEDDNYCQRVLYHGFKIGVLPQSYVIHDRAERKTIQPKKYTEAYFASAIRKFKVRFADVNNKEALHQLKLKLKYAKKQYLKAAFLLSFYNYKGLKKEYKTLKKLEKAVRQSYAVNKTKGSHYI
ncbi:glycosyltransferase family 2 protein [Winogradskyella sp. PC D3.3]